MYLFRQAWSRFTSLKLYGLYHLASFIVLSELAFGGSGSDGT
jgi:hypothetical protein